MPICVSTLAREAAKNLNFGKGFGRLARMLYCILKENSTNETSWQRGLDAVDLVIRHPQPDGIVLLQGPKRDHPAIAAFLETASEESVCASARWPR
jgi:hypothetical protein